MKINHLSLTACVALAAIGTAATSGCIKQSAEEALSRPTPTPEPSASASAAALPTAAQLGLPSGSPAKPSGNAAAAGPVPAAAAPSVGKMTKLPDGLQYEDVKVGKGEMVRPGQTAIMQYTGTLENGAKFDSTADHGGKPFPFQVGAGQVIKGWDEGVAGMKVGGERKLVIPGDLAYGANPPGGDIPPNATLLFDVTLQGISNGPPPPPE